MERLNNLILHSCVSKEARIHTLAVRLQSMLNSNLRANEGLVGGGFVSTQK